jgi:hypothetical protein
MPKFKFDLKPKRSTWPQNALNHHKEQLLQILLT